MHGSSVSKKNAPFLTQHEGDFGSHNGAIWEPFGSHFGAMLQTFLKYVWDAKLKLISNTLTML